MNSLRICILLACVAWQVCDAQEESRAPQRGLLKRGLLAKGKQTTTTTTTAAPLPQDEEYEQYEDEGEVANESTSEPPQPSSTEGKRLVGNGVRPFRSNTDLLEALKRRRAQVAEAKHQNVQHNTPAPQETAPVTQAPQSSKSSFNGKKRFSSSSRSEVVEETPAAAPVAAKPVRNRFNRPSKSIQSEPENEEHNIEAAQTRNSRTFSRRGSN